MSHVWADPPPLSEADFQQRIIDLAGHTGWHVVHYRAAWQAGKWRTPMTGDKGCPDLILARRGVVILAELPRVGNGKIARTELNKILEKELSSTRR